MANDQVRQRLLTLRAEAIAIERLLTSGGGANKRILRYVHDLCETVGALEILLDREDAA